MDILLELIEEEESREARETMLKIMDESCITKFNSVAEINQKIKPMGYTSDGKEIYKDNRVQDYYTNSMSTGLQDLNSGLRPLSKQIQQVDNEEDLTEVQMLNR